MQKEQFDRYADIEQRHWWFQARARIILSLLETRVPANRETRVVDIGCGTGWTTSLINERYTCMGIDPSPDAIALAQARFPQTKYIEGAIADCAPASLKEAKAVVILDVLEHVKDDRAFLRDIVSHLPKEAHVLVTVPAHRKLWSPHDEAAGHFRRYEETDLRALIASCGLEVEFLSHMNARLYPLVRFMRTISRMTGVTWGGAGMDLFIPSRPINALLRSVFAGEASALQHSALSDCRPPFRYGVSYVALLRT